MDVKTAKHSIHSVPFYIGIIILLSYLLLYGLVYLIDINLPTALTEANEKDYQESFIAERAIRNLEEFTKLGPRVTGSYENEFLSVDFLQRKIHSITTKAHINQKIEVDLHLVTGSYNLDIFSHNYVSAYANVQNVVVKLYGKSDNHSILVNSHFDSVPTSPGGSDDGINVVTMLEILLKLSKSADRLEHNIIFLFNGAEETPLQGSHGFITKHKWAKQCKVLVNLEACGVGGKIILFQSGPENPWLIKYYKMVPHPYGQVAGEEIFQSGIIPSDTDFRIFREFGGLTGFDMAFFKNGYRYHTKYDDFKSIPSGSFQHVGDNTLSLLKNLGNAPELWQDRPSKGKMVYFDVFGSFLVSYTTLTGNVINLMAILLSFGIFFYSVLEFKLGVSWQTLKYMSLSLAAILGSWLISALSVFIISFFLTSIGYSMTWFTHNWIIFGIYVVPIVAFLGCFLFFTKKKNLSLGIRCQIQAHLVRSIWSFILLIGTICNIRAVYTLLPFVVCNSLAFVFIHALRWQHTIRKWQVLYFVSLIIPSFLLMYQINTVFCLFIPMTGRIGSGPNPDLIVGFFTFFATLILLSPLVAIITLLRDSKLFFASLGIIFMTFLIMVFTPVGFPYRGDFNNPTPQRQWLTHTKRVFYLENGTIEKVDSGIMLLNQDRNSPNILKPFISELSKAKSLEEDCHKYLLCGLPVSSIKTVEQMKFNTYILAGQPNIPNPLKFHHNKEKIGDNIIQYNITCSGSDRLFFYLFPKKGVEVVTMRLFNSTFQSKSKSIFIIFTFGKDPADLVLSLDVKVPLNHSGAAVNIAVTAKYVHDKDYIKIPFYKNLISKMPNWVDVTAFLGSYAYYPI